jgi:hypothetical protein
MIFGGQKTKRGLPSPDDFRNVGREGAQLDPALSDDDNAAEEELDVIGSLTSLGPVLVRPLGLRCYCTFMGYGLLVVNWFSWLGFLGPDSPSPLESRGLRSPPRQLAQRTPARRGLRRLRRLWFRRPRSVFIRHVRLMLMLGKGSTQGWYPKLWLVTRMLQRPPALPLWYTLRVAIWPI